MIRQTCFHSLLLVFVCVGVSEAQDVSLVEAAARGDLAAARSLLARGANPNEVDNSKVKGWTPLMAAAGAASVDVAKAFIDAHADINAANEYGATALDIAVARHGASSGIAVFLTAAGGKGRESAVKIDRGTSAKGSRGGTDVASRSVLPNMILVSRSDLVSRIGDVFAGATGPITQTGEDGDFVVRAIEKLSEVRLYSNGGRLTGNGFEQDAALFTAKPGRMIVRLIFDLYSGPGVLWQDDFTLDYKTNMASARPISVMLQVGAEGAEIGFGAVKIDQKGSHRIAITFDGMDGDPMQLHLRFKDKDLGKLISLWNHPTHL